jgi:hypothetical protein
VVERSEDVIFECQLGRGKKMREDILLESVERRSEGMIFRKRGRRYDLYMSITRRIEIRKCHDSW